MEFWVCGEETVDRSDIIVHMLQCTFEDGVSVELRHAVITAIAEKDGKILMILRAPHLTNGNKYGLPGGFLDRDEYLNEAVKREVLEETGYDCEVVKLFRINDRPDRAEEDRQNVDFVYLVEILEKVSEPDKEVTEVLWVDLENLPSDDKIAFDHLEIINLYKKYKKEGTVLPIMNTF